MFLLCLGMNSMNEMPSDDFGGGLVCFLDAGGFDGYGVLHFGAYILL